MKDPYENVTDSLIISDEWDNFDYQLQLQIKELSEIGYDEKPGEWKKNTLASSYLSIVQKFLNEKGQLDNDTRAMIQDLRNAIEKYDGLKVLLQTLRVTILAARAGAIPEMVQAEIDKQDGRKQTMAIYQGVILCGVKGILDKAPTSKKWTLGYVMLKWDVYFKGREFYDPKTNTKYKAEKYSDDGKRGIRIVGIDIKKTYDYKERSLQKFIDEYKRLHSKITL